MGRRGFGRVAKVLNFGNLEEAALLFRPCDRPRLYLRCSLPIPDKTCLPCTQNTLRLLEPLPSPWRKVSATHLCWLL